MHHVQVRLNDHEAVTVKLALDARRQELRDRIEKIRATGKMDTQNADSIHRYEEELERIAQAERRMNEGER